MRLFLAFCFILLSVLQFVPVAADNNTAYQPFALREQNPFNLIHGQALPVDASLLDRSQLRWTTGLVISNTLNIEDKQDEAIYLDYESWRLQFSCQYGLGEGLNIKLDVPLIYQGGGVFDAAIDDWHRFFALPSGKRPQVDDDQYLVQYSDISIPPLAFNEAGTAPGDLQISAGGSLLENSYSALSLWAGLKLPTGDEDRLTGSGKTDFSAWLAYNRQLATEWLLNMNAGAVIPGGSHFKNMPLSDYVFYGHIMTAWVLTETVQLKLQLQGHTSYYEKSRLTVLGDSTFLSFGGSIKINRCNLLDVAFSEDVYVGASPDVSLLLSWRYTAGCL